MVVDSAADREYMRIALAHAARGKGRTSPNPMVGAVVVSADGIIVGTGYHQRAGEPHAEVLALGAAGERARGGTLYVTLEPCCHHGRTGPCVVPIVGAEIARVVAAVEDPHPLVAGGGIAFLREAGLDVTVGVGGDEASALNRAFFTAVVEGRPHVTMKVATSADGRVAEAPGRRTTLTAAESRRRVQLMRAELDAIGVGSETVLVDDPLLTVRDVYRHRPFLRVVFDRSLRTPPSAKVFGTLDAGPVVVATSAAGVNDAADRASALADAGAELVVTKHGSVSETLARLAERQVRSILIEGGPRLQRAFWEARVVDRVAVFVTPRVLGEGAVPWSLPPACSLADLAAPAVIPLGPDVLIEGDVHRTD